MEVRWATSSRNTLMDVFLTGEIFFAEVRIDALLKSMACADVLPGTIIRIVISKTWQKR